MNRFNQPKSIVESYKRSYTRSNTKSTSHIDPDPTIDIFEKNSDTRIVQIRLVFIRIGKKKYMNC